MILNRIYRGEGGHRLLTSEDLAKHLAARGKSSAGVNVTHERAMQYATVFACVRVLAESVGQLPLHLYRRQDRETLKALDHPLYSVLHVSPSPFQTAQEWKEWNVASLATYGNAYAQIIRLRGSVRELNAMPPAAVKPKRNPGSLETFYEVTLSDGKPETLPAREVLHLRLFSLNGLTGASPIAYAREAIGLGIGAEVFGAKLFENGATPGGVVSFPNELDDESYERIKASWDARHQGADNAHKVAILEQGGSFKEIGFPAKDAQFLETRKYQRSEIAGIFRVPPHMIGDLERATFSNIEHQGLDFVVHGLMPYLIRHEQRIALQLLTPEERREHFAKFNVAGLLRGDMAARASFYKELVNIGVLSPNMVLELEDMNPRDGGDIFLTPGNMAIDGKMPSADSGE